MAVAPRETFGGDSGRVRISLATSPDLLREGLQRLVTFAASNTSAD